MIKGKRKERCMTDFPAEAVELLLEWYAQYARDLPWRRDKDPYRILVSEIMLQQTRAETVKPYFANFLHTLPTLHHLATAEEATLMKLWEGLGYYSRVRNLQKAARKAEEDFGGEIPRDYQKLLSLPGVGRYTAGAVASIAFDIPVPAVDGNVLRVVARLTGDEGDVLQEATKKRIEACLAPHVPSPGAGDFNQSLIELGALVCLPGKEAKCSMCPLQLVCTAHREGRVAQLPVRIPKVKRRREDLTILLLCIDDGNGKPMYMIRKRAEKGLLGGLYEFPHVPGHLTAEEVQTLLVKEGCKVESITPLPPTKHIFTHLDWYMIGYACRISCYEDGAWPLGSFAVTPHELTGTYTIPTAFATYKKAVEEQ